MQLKAFLRVGLATLLALAGPCARAQAVAAPDARAPAPHAARAAADAVVDPAAGVPAVQYRSVFAATPAGVETGEVDWRRANDDVAQFPRGHVDILKWESMHGGKH